MLEPAGMCDFEAQGAVRYTAVTAIAVSVCLRTKTGLALKSGTYTEALAVRLRSFIVMLDRSRIQKHQEPYRGVVLQVKTRIANPKP